MDPLQPPSDEKVLTTLTPIMPCPLAAASSMRGYSYTAPQMQMHMPIMYPYLQTQLHQQLKFKPVRRERVVFSRNQYAILEAAYSTNHYPDVMTRDGIADQIGVQRDRVHCWFRNRRSRQRQAEKDQARREAAIKEELLEPQLREYPVTPIATATTGKEQPTHGYSISNMNTYLGEGVNLYHPYNNAAASNSYLENFYQAWLTPRNTVQRLIPVTELVKTVAPPTGIVKQEALSQLIDPATEEAIAVASITQQDEPEPSSPKTSSSSSYF